MGTEQAFRISAMPLGEESFSLSAGQILESRRFPVLEILPKPLRLVVEDTDQDEIWYPQGLQLDQLKMETDVTATQASIDPQEPNIADSNDMLYADKIRAFSIFRDRIRTELPEMDIIFADVSTLVQLDLAHQEQFRTGLLSGFFALSSTMTDDFHFLAVGREPGRVKPLRIIEVSQLPSRDVFATPVIVPA